jgi:hypothetical protein
MTTRSHARGRDLSEDNLSRTELDHVPYLKMYEEEIQAFYASRGMAYHPSYLTYVAASQAEDCTSLLHFEITVMQTLAKCRPCHGNEPKTGNWGSWTAGGARAATTGSPEQWLLLEQPQEGRQDAARSALSFLERRPASRCSRNGCCFRQHNGSDGRWAMGGPGGVHAQREMGQGGGGGGVRLIRLIDH